MNFCQFFPILLFCIHFSTSHSLQFTHEHTEEGFRVTNTNESVQIRLNNPYKEGRPSLKFELDGIRVSDIHLADNGNFSNYILELNDNSTAKFTSFEKINGSTSVIEYSLIWSGGNSSQNRFREVCFHYGFNNASWYSTYQGYKPEWPMNTSRSTEKQQFNFILDKKRLDQHEFFNILEHLFINTDGFAILLDEQCPWFIRRSPNSGNPLLCFSVNNTEPYMETSIFHDPSFFDIKIRLFASSNVKTVTDYVVNESGYIPRPTSHPTEEMFREPSWFNINKQEEATLLDYARAMAAHGYGHGNELSIYGNWEALHGDFQFSTKNFPNASEIMVHLTEQLGHRITLSISPNVNRQTFRTKRFFLKNSDGIETNLVDFGNPEASQWYLHLLKQLHYDFGIDSFLIVAPKAFEYSFRSNFTEMQRYPNSYIKKYLESIGQNNSLRITSNLGFKSQNLPIFYQLFNFDLANQGSLKSFLSQILSASIGGYSFITPSTIGFREQPLDEELYIRWLQAISLMPRMQFSVPPWKYSDHVKQLTEKYIQLHQSTVPTLIDLAKRRLLTGEPIIRPMWYIAPEDNRTYAINDQFMLGNDIIVAPILERNQTERRIYLPTDSWIDMRDHKVHDGPGFIRINVTLDDLPYFKRAIY